MPKVIDSTPNRYLSKHCFYFSCFSGISYWFPKKPYCLLILKGGGLVQAWESVCWGVERIPLIEKYRFLGFKVSKSRSFKVSQNHLILFRQILILYYQTYISYFLEDRRLGVSPTGNSFRFVRACVRAVCLPSGIGSQKWLPPFYLFPWWGAELSLFPSWGDAFSLFPSPPPQTSYPTLIGLTGKE